MLQFSNITTRKNEEKLKSVLKKAIGMINDFRKRHQWIFLILKEVLVSRRETTVYK